MNLVDRLLVYLPRLEPGSPEASVTVYLLNHLCEMRTMTIRELARRCSVSIATLSRFARRIGCRDFAAMKVELTAACIAREQKMPVEDPVQAIERAKADGMAWLHSADAVQLVALAAALRRTRTVLCQIPASPQSNALRREMLLAGKQIRFVSDAAEAAAGLAELEPDEMALLQIETLEQWLLLRPALVRRGSVVTAALCSLPLPDVDACLDYPLQLVEQPDLGRMQREWLLYLLTQTFRN